MGVDWTSPFRLIAMIAGLSPAGEVCSFKYNDGPFYRPLSVTWDR